MIVLGVNAYHGDASACLLQRGGIVAAAEEERFQRVKHWAGFPSQAIRYCLAEAKVSLADVTHVALNSDPKANLWRRIGFAVSGRAHPRLLLDRLRNQQKRLTVRKELETAFPLQKFRGDIHHVEHHLAHMASAFHVSPFEEAAIASVDGFGDFASAAWGTGRGDELTIEGRVWFPHSLGAFYQAITQYLGFPNYGDEYKVMGLAAYGKPRLLDSMRRMIHLNENGTFALDLAYFRHHEETIDYKWSGGAPHVGALYSPELENLLGPVRREDEEIDDRHRDIARSAQAMYEEAFFNLLNKLYQLYRLTDLTIAGGCAMNSVANGKIRRLSPFERVYVQPAPGDAGGAVGAAMHVWSKLRASSGTPTKGAPEWSSYPARVIMDNAYFGPSYDNEAIAAVLHSRADEFAALKCQIDFIDDEELLCARAAQAIARGEVVGWFQGRMEWGPRALGNRSIVCDPRRADMKNLLNLKIKRREWFRPLAPSILRECVREWFEEEADVPFMTQVLQIRLEKRPLIPAVTHFDGSGRLQTVHRETNPRYHRLIRSFQGLTGVPLLLNTSFNENEPLVCKPEEALNCFLRTEMDMLTLGNYVVTRAPIEQEESS